MSRCALRARKRCSCSLQFLSVFNSPSGAAALQAGLLRWSVERKSNDRMRDIGAVNFASLDLNLLRVFDAMMLELSTVRAGERVGLSQPAVSSALGRLRQLLGDELFIRDGNRMVPTPRALQLKEPVRNALRQIEQALAAAATFDPATSQLSFVILGSDYFSTLLMPRLARQIVPEAPGVTVQMLDYPTSE